MTKQANILFIMTDQQHFGMMSCAGNPGIKTPAMDSLARDGIRFEKAYCVNPFCSPSRTAMATGMMSCRLGADNNDMAMQITSLPSEVATNNMGMLMKNAGYDTFYGGKVHMCDSLAPGATGYDVYMENGRDALVPACIDFITKKREKPFFAVASFINPHDVCYVNSARNGEDIHGLLDLYKEAAELPDDALPPLPDNYAIPEDEPAAIQDSLRFQRYTPTKLMRKTYTDRDWRIYRWIYQRLTEKVDSEIGKLLAGLEKAGLDENTLIIFTSDHGDMDASHHLTSKCIPYEESVRVPFIMRHSGVIPPGQVDSRHLLSTGLDLLPTLCDYAGIPKPALLLGKSLRPLAESGRVDNWRRYVASENDWFRMIRSQRFKYCAFSIADRRELLMDLEEDPGEMRNLANDPAYSDVLSEHRNKLADWSRESADPDYAKYAPAENIGS